MEHNLQVQKMALATVLIEFNFLRFSAGFANKLSACFLLFVTLCLVTVHFTTEIELFNLIYLLLIPLIPDVFSVNL